MRIARRALLAGSAAAGAFAAMSRAQGGALDDVAAQARREGPVVWYQTNPLDLIEPVVQAFQQRFPGVRLAPLRMVGGAEMGARIVQEIQAGAPTADVGTGGRDSVMELARRGWLGTADWAALGVPRELVLAGSLIATSSSVYAIVSNTQLLSEAEAPRGWEELLDPRWSGRLASWTTSAAFANLAKVWGEERTARYVERFAAQKPLLFRSQFSLTQAVAAGEVPVGIAAHSTTTPMRRAGAPIRLSFGSPVSVSSFSSFFVNTTRNPNGARLLLGWIGSAEGARAIEDATDSGVHMVYPTRMAGMLRGLEISEFGPDEQDKVTALRHRFNAILRSGGKDAG